MRPFSGKPHRLGEEVTIWQWLDQQPDSNRTFGKIQNQHRNNSFIEHVELPKYPKSQDLPDLFFQEPQAAQSWAREPICWVILKAKRCEDCRTDDLHSVDHHVCGCILGTSHLHPSPFIFRMKWISWGPDLFLQSGSGSTKSAQDSTKQLVQLLDSSERSDSLYFMFYDVLWCFMMFYDVLWYNLQSIWRIINNKLTTTIAFEDTLPTSCCGYQQLVVSNIWPHQESRGSGKDEFCRVQRCTCWIHDT